MSLLYSVLCNLCPSVTFRHLPSPSVTFRHLPSSSVTFRHSPSLSVTHGEQYNFVPPYILPQLSALFRTFSVILKRIITISRHGSNTPVINFPRRCLPGYIGTESSRLFIYVLHAPICCPAMPYAKY